MVGKPHEIKGQAVAAFVTVKEGVKATPALAERTEGARRPQDRRDRPARSDSVCRRSAEDPIGQDHAPAAARHRRRQGARRHDHARRSRRRCEAQDRVRGKRIGVHLVPGWSASRSVGQPWPAPPASSLVRASAPSQAMRPLRGGDAESFAPAHDRGPRLAVATTPLVVIATAFVPPSRRFPRRAVVVSWGLPTMRRRWSGPCRGRNSMKRPASRSNRVLTPPTGAAASPNAPAPGSRRAAIVWLALNTDGVAIAIVPGRDLLFTRTFPLELQARSDRRREAQLLQRYTLVAHLAPEVRHGIDVVRAVARVAGGWGRDLRRSSRPAVLHDAAHRGARARGRNARLHGRPSCRRGMRRSTDSRSRRRRFGSLHRGALVPADGQSATCSTACSSATVARRRGARCRVGAPTRIGLAVVRCLAAGDAASSSRSRWPTQGRREPNGAPRSGRRASEPLAAPLRNRPTVVRPINRRSCGGTGADAAAARSTAQGPAAANGLDPDRPDRRLAVDRRSRRSSVGDAVGRRTVAGIERDTVTPARTLRPVASTALESRFPSARYHSVTKTRAVEPREDRSSTVRKNLGECLIQAGLITDQDLRSRSWSRHAPASGWARSWFA